MNELYAWLGCEFLWWHASNIYESNTQDNKMTSFTRWRQNRLLSFTRRQSRILKIPKSNKSCSYPSPSHSLPRRPLTCPLWQPSRAGSEVLGEPLSACPVASGKWLALRVDWQPGSSSVSLLGSPLMIWQGLETHCLPVTLPGFSLLRLFKIPPGMPAPSEVALYICKFHIHRFNQIWTENIYFLNSRNFQKAKPEFATY